MKRVTVFIVCILMILSVFAGCTQSSEPSTSPSASTSADASASPSESADANDPMAEVEPLEERTTLVVCQLVGGAHSAVSYIIDKLGGFEKANIDVEFLVFPNGNLMVEAIDTWDVATYGTGGCYGGTKNDATYIIGNAYHDTGFRFFARKDSDIVAEGNTVPEYPSLLGSKETWTGKEILIPSGTTLHAFMLRVMEVLGMSADDMKMTHMEVSNVNTAFRAGNGDIGAMWVPQSLQSDLDEKFVCIADSTLMGYETANCLTANKKSYDDPQKTKAIEKWVELFYRTAAWMYESDENLQQAAEWYNEWNQEQGAASSVEDSLRCLETTKVYQIDEAIKLFETETEVDGIKMNEHEKMQYEPLKIFVELGNYEESLIDKMLSEDTYRTDYLYSAREAIQG